MSMSASGKLYTAAYNAFRRCYDRRASGYAGCGGKGIRVQFKGIWEMVEYLQTLPGSSDGRLKLIRLDRTKDFAPGNLAFAFFVPPAEVGPSEVDAEMASMWVSFRKMRGTRTYKEMAEATGLPQSYFSYAESGKLDRIPADAKGQVLTAYREFS